MPDPRATELARRLRRNQTETEAAAWELLRGRRLGGAKFRRQVVVYGFVVDFYCAELRLAIELDGDVHDSDAAIDYDRARTRHLARHNVRVIRVRNEQLDERTLRRAVDCAKKSPPLHERGEGDGG